ncbi:unnamed protein product [Nyctereutes procyonoides]|uniref:(raccoon dog) hypothetical protein n=1 Tax=Nyctereutes procyonoides TaxID=34880 RepID=A0A811ZZX5_NYCPR|nr:unnamed protein product [Nyctereutes procyonoides]
MNGHASPPPDALAATSTALTGPKTMKAMEGTSTPSGPRPQAALSAQSRSIAGVYVEASSQAQSLYATMKQGLLSEELGLALLEAQAATGGLVDPTQGQILSVSEAVQQGLVGLELKGKLLAAERAVTGYPDPYGGGRLSLFQAIRKEVVDRARGWSWLEAQLATGGLADPIRGVRVAPELACQQGLLDQETWHLLGRCVRAPATGLALLPLKITFHTLSGAVSLAELLEVGILDEETGQGLQEGKLAVPDVSSRADVKRYLQGTGGVAGVVQLPAGHKKSIFQAITEHLLPMGTGLLLLEAQAATCTLVDPAAGFSDPSIQESLGYGQLLARCITDPETGLAFLPLSHGPPGDEPQGSPFIDHSTRQALSEATATVSVGKFQGRPVSLWELLFSGPVPTEQRAALAQQYRDGAISVEEMAAVLTAALEQAAAVARTTFAGLRVPVTPDELLKAEIIEQDVYEQLKQGQTTAQEVGRLASVQRYLRGTGCIAGVLVPGSQERLSIYEAREKGLLRPGTALILLEAQAATGFILNPKENKSSSVEAALRAGLIGPDVFAKLLSAERAVTGYKDPYTGEQISLFQAMQKELIVRDHGIRLLEAQIATGGIIDPVHSHRLPVDVAYQCGYFDEEMNHVLADPSDDTKGFFDPNTHENLTYLQLLERCVLDPDTGLYMLPLGSVQTQLVDGATRQAFQSLLLSVKYGRFRGQTVSAWELINSECFSEDQRRRVLQDYRRHRVSLEQVAQLLEREMGRGLDVMLPTLRGRVPAHRLLEARIIDQELLDRVLEGAVSPEAVLHMDHVQRYLRGSGAVGGVLLRPSGQRLSLYEAMKQKLLGPGVQAEDAITGVHDPFSGKSISLFQAMKKGLVPLEQAARLLDAQVATGGIIDPTGHYHLPLPVATQHGYINQEMEMALSSSSKTFPTPDGRGHTSYARLLEQCLRDEASGLSFLPLPENAPAVPTDEQVQETLQGAEDGMSLWELLGSCHFTDEQRKSFLEDLRVGKTTVQQLHGVVQKWVQEAELLARARVTVPGPRGEVPAVWLLDAGIITQETLTALAQGTQSPAEVAEQPAVKRHLWGTGCVAGVLLRPSGIKVSISQAVRDGLLPEGLGQRLLEAQVASGSLIDPLTNQRLSVEGAVQAGLVAGALSEQLRQAEKAVAGYTDPYSGGCLALWQAMEKGLVPRGEGLRLLQVQLATGGAVDPGHGVHLPEAVAYRLGLLDEQVSQVLTSTDEDSKFFFDPGTKDKVTYSQLKERCVLDADTGLWLLPLAQDTVLEVDEHTLLALRAMKVPVSTGRFKGLSVSLWDLLHSEYVGSNRRRELVALCQSGRATALQQVATAVTALVVASETQATFRGLRKLVSASDLFRSRLIDKETLDELNQGKKTVQEVMEMGSVRRYLEGGNFIAGVLVQGTKEKMSISEALRRHILRPGTALVLLEAQAATGFLIDPVRNQRLTVEEAFATGMFGQETYWKLLSAERAVTGYTDPYTGEQISLFQAIHRLPVDVAYQRGYFDEEMNRVLADPSDDTKGFFDPNTHENLTYLQLLERCVLDPDTGLYMLQIVKKGEAYIYTDEATRQVLQSQTTEMHVGRFAHQKISFWDLLSSEYFTEERKRELIQEVRAQNVPLEQLLEIITATVEETEEQYRGMKVAAIGGEVTAAELFNSGITDKRTLDALSREKSGAQDLSRMAHVKTYLEGRGCIAGITVPLTQEVMSLYDANRKGLIPMGFAVQMLEAQAATGFVLDPCGQRKLSVQEAVAEGLVGEEWQARLLEAEKAARGYTDPATGHTLSLFQAMQRKMVRREDALRLLEMQVATGGVIDPLHHHRLPLGVAYRRGCLHQDTYPLVSDQRHMRKRFVDPNNQERVTYQQLQERSQKEAETGWALFMVTGDTQRSNYDDEATRRALEAEQVQVQVGRYKDQTLSVWEMLNSEYVTHKRKLELLREYKDHVNQVLEEARKVILQIMEDQEKSKKQIWFPGIRKQITAVELFKAAILSKELLDDLAQGTKTPQEVTEMDSVKRYLRGTSCIAGVLVPAKDEPGRQEKMSVYQAMWKGVLRPGTALVLLEAQAGPLRGQRPSVWDVLFSSYLSRARRDELLAQHAAGALALPGLVAILTRAVEEAEERLSKVTFRGLRRQVSASELRSSGILGPETLRDLAQGTKTPQEVTEMDSVKRYLRGTSCIAGVLVPAKDEPGRQEKMSVYQAMWKGVLRPGTALVLLEAQAATGFLIDPVRNQGLTVEEAVAAGLVGGEIQDKLLSAERAVTGYTDPYTGEQISLFQAMQKELIVRDHGIRLLEAQVATGGIIDPVHSHRLPVDVAYQRGYFDEEMNRVLADPSDDTKGFFDPNTHENLTYVQLLRRCVLDPDTGLYMLQLAAGGSAVHQLSEELRGALRDARVAPGPGVAQGQSVSVWELLFYREVPEGERQDLLRRYRAGSLTAHEVGAALTALLARRDPASPGARPPDPRGALRAATMEAVAAGLVGGEIQDKLLSAERAVTGYTDPYTGEQISLFQAMQKELIVRDHGIRLLEAQVATGGIIDPVHSHRLPVDVAYQRGYFDEEMNRVLADPSDDTKGFFDPNTHENLTYMQLLQIATLDSETGLLFLSLA